MLLGNERNVSSKGRSIQIRFSWLAFKKRLTAVKTCTIFFMLSQREKIILYVKRLQAFFSRLYAALT